MEKSKLFVVVLAALVLIACCVSAGCTGSQTTVVPSSEVTATPVPTQVQTSSIPGNSVVGDAWVMVVNGKPSEDYLVFKSDGSFEETLDLREYDGGLNKLTFHWTKGSNEGVYLQVIGKTATGMFVLLKDGSEMTRYTESTNTTNTYVRIPLADVPK